MTTRTKTRWIQCCLIWGLAASCSTAAMSQQASPPQPLLDEIYTLTLQTTKDGCGAKASIKWSPRKPGPINLQVGDTYRVTPVLHTRSERVVSWKWRWEWRHERKCGKDKCITNETRDRDSFKTFALGEDLLVTVYEDKRENRVISDRVVEGTRTKPGTLLLAGTPPKFTIPTDGKPDPRARLTVPICSTIDRPAVRVMDLKIKIVRRSR